MKEFVKAEIEVKDIILTADSGWDNKNHKGNCYLKNHPTAPEYMCSCGYYKKNHPDSASDSN